jgi:hypothetical protein
MMRNVSDFAHIPWLGRAEKRPGTGLSNHAFPSVLLPYENNV